MDAEIEWLADQLIACFPPLAAQEQAIALAVYRALAGGTSVDPGEVARQKGLEPRTVEEALASWPAVWRGSDGRITGFWGLGIEPTLNRIEIDGCTSYAWCAWDPLFLSDLLDVRIHVASRCPVSGEGITLTVSPGGVETASPRGVVISLFAPDVQRARENVVGAFCRYVHLFATPAAAEAWSIARPGTRVMDPDAALAIGQRFNAAHYPQGRVPSSV